MKHIKRLGDAELDIMQVIWSSDEPVNSQFISQGLHGKRDWQLPTLLTVLSRLVEKGFLTVARQGRSNYYTAIISRTEYQESEGKQLLEKLYSGSMRSLMSALVGSKAVDQKDLSDLRNYLDELEQK
jgi:predicted transcriptional regulator